MKKKSKKHTKKAPPVPKIEPFHAEKVQSYYESIANCASITGIPIASIRLAKRSGCTAFAGPRVHLLPLLRWIFSQQPSDDGIDWSNELKKEMAKNQKIKREKAELKTIGKPVVETCLAAGTAKLFGALDRQDNSELPSILFGITKEQIQAALIAAHAALKSEFDAALDTLIAEDLDTLIAAAAPAAPAKPKS